MCQTIRKATLTLVLALVASPAVAQQPVQYRASFPLPEHHYADVEITFPNVPAGASARRGSDRQRSMWRLTR